MQYLKYYGLSGDLKYFISWKGIFSTPHWVFFQPQTCQIFLVTDCSISSRLIRITSLSSYLLTGFLVACTCAGFQLFLSVVNFIGNSISWPIGRVFSVLPSFVAMERCSWQGWTDGRKCEENNMRSSLLVEFVVLKLLPPVWGWVGEQWTFQSQGRPCFGDQAFRQCHSVGLNTGTQNAQAQQTFLAELFYVCAIAARILSFQI